MNTDEGRRGSRLRIAAWTAGAVLMVVPLLAMQVTDEVAWDAADFAILGALLVSVGVAFELAVRKTVDPSYRIATAVALGAAFLLLAVTGAVGIIGAAHDDANLMFGGVLAVGLIGAVLSRFRAPGMARALIATAFAQVLVGVVALIAGLGSSGPIWPWDVLGLTAFFTAMWSLSARLFLKSAR